MDFLTNGDFGFPFTWLFYALKQFYTWSYQTGAANLDGIIRMPARLLYLLIFGLFGSLAFEYFYIFSTLIVAFAAFYYFAGAFLEAKRQPAKIVASLFFALNPIFLGNLAKTGLILAVAVLPLCLVVADRAAKQNRYRHYIIWVLLLNISFIHPFTFTINLLVSATYFVYRLTKTRDFRLRQRLPKLGVVFVIALAVNAYLILPVLGMHTISKDALSNSISATPVDYTALVDTLNTQDIFTGLSLSKNILLDFDFYNAAYKNVYFLGVFGFYVLLLGAYIFVRKRLAGRDQIRTATFVLLLLGLAALATVNFLNLGELIKAVINLPGGWAFRSPLKWQLYIPVAIAGWLAIVLKYLDLSSKYFKLVVSGFVLSFVLMNAFLAAQVYTKLLVPRKVTYFSALASENFNHNNALFINSDACDQFQRQNPRAIGELNQILSSKQLQLKQISQADVPTITIGSYDYVFSCQDSAASFLQNYAFTLQHSFVGGAVQLYGNQHKVPFVAVSSTSFSTSAALLDSKYAFALNALKTAPDFVLPYSAHYPTLTLKDVFENLDAGDIRGGTINAVLPDSRNTNGTLYIQNVNQQLYYTYDLQSGHIAFSAQPQAGYQVIQPLQLLPIAVPAGRPLTLAYTDTSFTYKNEIENADLSAGLWQKKVGDCYNYDVQPQINMQLTRGSSGAKALALAASRHIACTGPADVAVTAGVQYLLDFQYRSIGGKSAGYSLAFNDPKHTVYSGRLQSGGWADLSKGFVAPPGASLAHILFYGYPNGSNKGVAYYQNIRLIAVPPVQHIFYWVGGSNNKSPVPPAISYSADNPTRTSITLTHATTPFYLNLQDTYSPLWQLGTPNDSALAFGGVRPIAAKDHAASDGSLNQWYVDPAEVCAQASAACVKNRDGSYNMKMAAVFAPQKWFEVGSGLSLVTLLVIGGFFGWLYVKTKRTRSANRLNRKVRQR